MSSILSGWIGYGTSVQAGFLAEPSDAAYARRPLVLGELNGGIVLDVGSGTVGPASSSWGSVGFVGIFDAQTAGNLLLWVPLPGPITVAPGQTISTIGGTLQIAFSDLKSAASVRTWPARTQVGTTPDGRPVSSGVAIQFSGGMLSSQVATFGATIVMASLPQTQPASGTGQLWNNGGIISVA